MSDDGDCIGPSEGYEFEDRYIKITEGSVSEPEEDGYIYDVSCYRCDGSRAWQQKNIVVSGEISHDSCKKIGNYLLCFEDEYTDGWVFDVRSGEMSKLIDDGVVDFGEKQLNVKYGVYQVRTCNNAIAILDQVLNSKSGSRVIIYNWVSGEIIDKRYGQKIFTIECTDENDILVVRQRAKNFTIDI